MRRFALFIAASAFLSLTALRAAAKSIGPPPPNPSSPSEGPAWEADSDGDGVLDVWDTCPSYPPGMTAPNPKPSARSRDPYCYLNLSWTKGEPWGAAVVNGAWTLGSGWTGAQCVPAMAYPIDDRTADGPRFIGVVILGVASGTDTSKVLQDGRSGLPWPSDGPVARCLVSIDYGDPGRAGLVAPFGITAPTLATFYALWRPYVPHFAQRFTIADGLGLVRTTPNGNGVPVGITGVSTRDPKQPTVERIAFTRGVLFGGDLATSTYLSIAPAAGKPSLDPTKGAPSSNGYAVSSHSLAAGDTIASLTSSNAGAEILFHAGEWAVVPTGLDRALSLDAAAVQAAFATAKASIEAVPQLLEDDRWPDVVAFATYVQLRDGGHAFAPPFTVSPAQVSDDPKNPWLIVPSAVAWTKQDEVVGKKLRPASPATYAAAVGSGAAAKTLVEQAFPVTDRSVPFLRHVEVTWPDARPTAATSEANPDYGVRWASNAPESPGSTTPCFGQVGIDRSEPASESASPYPALSAAGTDAIASSWCSGVVERWWDHQYSQTQALADTACYGATRAIGNISSAGSFLNAIPDTDLAACQVLKNLITAPRDAVCCAAAIATFGFVGSYDCCNPLEITKDELSGNAQCFMDWVAKETHDNLPNDIHWLNATRASYDPLGKQLVPLVAMVRTGLYGGPRQVWSHVTFAGDLFLNRAHQGTDWNWVLGSELGPRLIVDPQYGQVSLREDVGFKRMENELELLVAQGRWDDATYDLDNELPEVDLHGGKALDYLLGLPQDWVGQVWPNELCHDFGLDIGNPDEPSSGPKPEKPQDYPLPLPSEHCAGEAFAKDAWREMFGRAMFAPIAPQTLFGTTSAVMSTNPQWPSSSSDPQSNVADPDVPFGFADWSTVEMDGRAYDDFPHRLSFFGRPILDCGHEGSQLEIHPPHVMTMDLRVNADKASGATGLDVTAFGWVNVSIDGHLEFDLWPPPRPSANARFVSLGATQRLNRPAGLPGEYGYVIDDSGPQHVASQASTLSCTPAPTQFPNHLHCAYDDASPALQTQTYDYQHDNPRMDPKFATSRFDMKVFLGWAP